MEDKTVKHSIDFKASHLAVTKEKQKEEPSFYECITPEESQNSIKLDEIKSNIDFSNTCIKTERDGDNVIDAQVEYQMLVEEKCIKKEEIDIKNEILSFQSASTTDVLQESVTYFEDARKRNSSSPNATCDLTTCSEVIEDGSSYVPTKLFHQNNCTKDFQIYKREAYRENSFQEFDYRTCLYNTNDRSKFTRFSDCPEVELYKCRQCEYKTKSKAHLKRHTLRHQDASEVQMFHCEFCTFQTKYKQVLTVHLLSHKNPTEVEMFKCEVCEYRTKYKGILKRHMLCHKHPSEAEMFSCELCEHSTKYKKDLKIHMLIHKPPSEVNTFKCGGCQYSSKHRSALKRHVLNHSDPSNVELFECELCTFSTRHKYKLKPHLLIHKDPSEVKIFKCDMCEYSTRNRSSVKRHMLRHKLPSEVEMFKCDACEFSRKHRCSLQKHTLTHKC